MTDPFIPSISIHGLKLKCSDMGMVELEVLDPQGEWHQLFSGYEFCDEWELEFSPGRIIALVKESQEEDRRIVPKSSPPDAERQ